MSQLWFLQETLAPQPSGRDLILCHPNTTQSHCSSDWKSTWACQQIPVLPACTTRQAASFYCELRACGRTHQATPPGHNPPASKEADCRPMNKPASSSEANSSPALPWLARTSLSSCCSFGPDANQRQRQSRYPTGDTTLVIGGVLSHLVNSDSVDPVLVLRKLLWPFWFCLLPDPMIYLWTFWTDSEFSS